MKKHSALTNVGMCRLKFKTFTHSIHNGAMSSSWLLQTDLWIFHWQWAGLCSSCLFSVLLSDKFQGSGYWVVTHIASEHNTKNHLVAFVVTNLLNSLHKYGLSNIRQCPMQIFGVFLYLFKYIYFNITMSCMICSSHYVDGSIHLRHFLNIVTTC